VTPEVPANPCHAGILSPASFYPEKSRQSAAVRGVAGGTPGQPRLVLAPGEPGEELQAVGRFLQRARREVASGRRGQQYAVVTREPTGTLRGGVPLRPDGLMLRRRAASPAAAPSAARAAGQPGDPRCGAWAVGDTLGTKPWVTLSQGLVPSKHTRALDRQPAWLGVN